MISMLTVVQFTLLLLAQAFVILFLAATRESLYDKIRRLEADISALRGMPQGREEAPVQRVRAPRHSLMRPIA